MLTSTYIVDLSFWKINNEVQCIQKPISTTACSCAKFTFKTLKEDTSSGALYNLFLKTYSNNFVFKTLNLIDRILIMISAKSVKRNAKRLCAANNFAKKKAELK